MRRAADLAVQVLTNAFGIRPAEKELTYGAGLDFAVSLINHSCLPNAHIFVEGREVRVRALRPLQAGDEITAAYVEPCLGVLERREKLNKIFFIHCNCMASLSSRRSTAPSSFPTPPKLDLG